MFADVVSIDAWHSPFDGKSGTASLHVDVVFNTARLGGEATAPVRFRLSLKRAELVVILPPTEPLEIIRSSVDRTQNTTIVQKTDRIIDQKHANIHAGARVSTSSPFITAVNAETGLGMRSQSNKSVSVESQTSMVLVTQSQTSEGHYRWELKSAVETQLSGRGWEAKTEPRFKFRDKRKKKSHLTGSMRVELRCRREDLLIEDIQVKNEPLLAKLRSASSLRNKIIAVESYLKNALLAEDLHFTDVSDPFGELCLADLMVEELGQ